MCLLQPLNEAEAEAGADAKAEPVAEAESLNQRVPSFISDKSQTAPTAKLVRISYTERNYMDTNQLS